MHNAAFSHLGLNAVYVAFPVTDLSQAVAGLKGLNICGVSVTIPFKEEILPLLDEVDTVAARMGAVNTVVNRDGRLIGHNTDWLGAVAALEDKTEVAGKRFLILGAGGAARAIAFGLVERGGQVAVSDLDTAKALALGRQLWVEVVAPGYLEQYPAEILINATPMGMAPDDAGIPIDPLLLSRFELVMDIVYRPLKTRLLREAEAKGCQIVDGLRMLIHQGALQCELWTGNPAPVEVMAGAVYLALGREAP